MSFNFVAGTLYELKVCVELAVGENGEGFLFDDRLDDLSIT
jgi:hypothetical protein